MQTSPKKLLYLVYTIYFVCGLAQCFEGTFLPEFKQHFQLTYTAQMYILFAKNIPFVCFSILIGYATRRFGFKNALAFSLVLFALGTFLLVPGLHAGNYSLILSAFFILGTGFNVELVAGNPLLSLSGPPEASASRLNKGSALGAIAQIIAPLFVAVLIPANKNTVVEKLPYIQGIFMATGIVLSAMAVYTFLLKDTIVEKSKISVNDTRDVNSGVSIWRQPKVMLGFISIFLVLGFEACLFGFFRNFAEDRDIIGLSAHRSQQLFTLYFAIFALGRLVGSYLQKKIKPAVTLVVGLMAALLLLIPLIWTKGWPAMAAATAIGFFVSIFFPTLFSMAIEGLKGQVGAAAGILTMGFLGGALLPVLQGKLADSMGLQFSYSMGFVPYLFALLYVWKGRGKTFSISTLKNN